METIMKLNRKEIGILEDAGRIIDMIFIKMYGSEEIMGAENGEIIPTEQIAITKQIIYSIIYNKEFQTI